MRLPAIALSSALCLAACAESTPVDQSEDSADTPIVVEADTRRVVENYLAQQYPASDDLAYSYGMADLDGMGEDEYLVYVGGPSMCGSGGCTLLVLQPDGDGFRKIGSLSVAQLPVGVLSTTTNGYKDLGVTIGGGGLERTIAKVPYGGSAYAANPTTEPSNPVGSIDLVVIPDSELTPLPPSG